MIARYSQEGKAINYRPETDVAAGEVIVLGSLIGIARLDIQANTLGALAVSGVFEIQKAEIAITAGASVYWDDTAKNVTLTAAGNPYLGKSIAAASAETETVYVLLGSVANTTPA